MRETTAARCGCCLQESKERETERERAERGRIWFYPARRGLCWCFLRSCLAGFRSSMAWNVRPAVRILSYFLFSFFVYIHIIHIICTSKNDTPHFEVDIYKHSSGCMTQQDNITVFLFRYLPPRCLILLLYADTGRTTHISWPPWTSRVRSLFLSLSLHTK